MRLFSIFFLLGTLLIQLFTDLPSLLCVALLFSCSIIVTLIFIKRSWRFNKSLISFLGLSFGLLLATIAAQQQLSRQLDKRYEGVDLVVHGKVVDIPNNKEDGIRFRLNVSKAVLEDDRDISVNLKGIIRIGWYQWHQDVHAGETWNLRVRLKRPSGFLNPGGFDYEKWLFTQRISATGYVRKPKSDVNYRLKEAPWWSINHLRELIHLSVQQKTNNKASASVLSALLVAVRTDLTDEQWKVFRNTGTSHLVAISGLHIAVVAGFAFFPIMLLWRLFPRLNEKIPVFVAGGIAGVCSATLYALLAGFTLPTQRALLMVVIALFGLISRKNYSSSVILAGALTAVLILDPLSAMTASFWLSFLAVSLILIFLKRQMKQPRFQLIKLQFLLSLGMLPLTLYFFGSASLSSPLANLFAIPWVSFIVVPLSLIALILMPISTFLSNAVFSVATVTIDWLFKGLSIISDTPLNNFISAEIPSYYLLIAFLGLLFLLLPKGFPARWLGLVAFVPVLMFSSERPKYSEFEYALLDAGQGMASVLHTKKHTLVYDTGTKISDSYDIGKLVVVPYLQSKGLSHINQLIVSHNDIDHSGGAKTILKEMHVDEVLSSSSKIQVGQEIRLCKKGQKWQWDGVDFEILGPDEDYPKDDNNQSCVLKVSNQKHSLLLTGDIEKKTEKRLLQDSKAKLNSEVLIVPHHGSKTSSSVDFIKAVSPQLGLLPVGYRNRYGHPKKRIMDRYKELNINVLDTVRSGAIQILFPLDSSNKENSQILIKEYRLDHKKFWNK